MAPYKPDEDEINGYYYGIAGNPRLVARTSGNHWTMPRNEGPYTGRRRKQFAPITKRHQPEIVSRWSKNPDRTLVQTLKGCRWSYFFPVRIGLDDSLDTKYPAILLIAVEPNTLQWEQGVAIALECRKILQNFEIIDVEVEIREGRYISCAASTDFEQQIDQKVWLEPGMTNSIVLPMLSSLGYTIGYAEQRRSEGSLGLHLKLGDRPGVYGLTCRHVVSSGRPANEEYRVSEHHKQYHVQAGDHGFMQCYKELEKYQRKIQGFMKPLQRIRAFSAKGDSGASVFDTQGNILGLVSGGTADTPNDQETGWTDCSDMVRELKKYPDGGVLRPEKTNKILTNDLTLWPDGYDVTFVSPIHWVLEDIERFTGLTPRLAD